VVRVGLRHLPLLLLGVTGHAAAEPRRPAVLLMVQASGRETRALGTVEERLVESQRYRVVLMQALLPLMQQADGRADLLKRANELMEQGRQAMVALDQSRARTLLEQARTLLTDGFVRYYDPRVLAQVHLLLGAIYLEQQARPDLARQEFVEVHRLDPGFKLDAHYSPRVRAAFEEAARGLPPPPSPAPDDVRRLAKLAGAEVAIVLTVQPAGEQSLVQGSLFLVDRGYSGVESRLVDPDAPQRLERQTGALGLELRAKLEARFPPPPKKKIVKKKKKIVPPPPPPPRPWYKRWYTWTAVGVAVASAIILPLALRTKTADVTVELP